MQCFPPNILHWQLERVVYVFDHVYPCKFLGDLAKCSQQVGSVFIITIIWHCLCTVLQVTWLMPVTLHQAYTLAYIPYWSTLSNLHMWHMFEIARHSFWWYKQCHISWMSTHQGKDFVVGNGVAVKHERFQYISICKYVGSLWPFSIITVTYICNLAFIFWWYLYSVPGHMIYGSDFIWSTLTSAGPCRASWYL